MLIVLTDYSGLVRGRCYGNYKAQQCHCTVQPTEQKTTIVVLYQVVVFVCVYVRVCAWSIDFSYC